MNNYDRDISVMINGRSYFLSGWGEPHKDGSRKVYMRLNHNSLCQIMQQDGDETTCTCLDELDTVNDLVSNNPEASAELSNPPKESL